MENWKANKNEGGGGGASVKKLRRSKRDLTEA